MCLMLVIRFIIINRVESKVVRVRKNYKDNWDFQKLRKSNRIITTIRVIKKHGCRKQILGQHIVDEEGF